MRSAFMPLEAVPLLKVIVRENPIKRKVIISEWVSLDGIMMEPAATIPYWNDDIAKFSASLKGKKVIVSLNIDNVEEEVSKLKQSPGQDLLFTGKANLVQTLMQLDLIDEYRLMVCPVIRGNGGRLFKDETATTNLKLVESKTFCSGVVALVYHPEKRMISHK